MKSLSKLPSVSPVRRFGRRTKSRVMLLCPMVLTLGLVETPCSVSVRVSGPPATLVVLVLVRHLCPCETVKCTSTEKKQLTVVIITIKMTTTVAPPPLLSSWSTDEQQMECTVTRVSTVKTLIKITDMTTRCMLPPWTRDSLRVTIVLSLRLPNPLTTFCERSMAQASLPTLSVKVPRELLPTTPTPGTPTFRSTYRPLIKPHISPPLTSDKGLELAVEPTTSAPVKQVTTNYTSIFFNMHGVKRTNTLAEHLSSLVFARLLLPTVNRRSRQ